MWGKIFGGMAGFAMGGPLGAIVGAALGHAAETGDFTRFQAGFSFGSAPPPRALPGARDQVFSLCVVVLAAKLAKCDGAVNRAEIDAFKRSFRIPADSARDVGRLFDQARDSPEGYASYAARLGRAFDDNPGLLEDVLAALHAVARADGPLNRREQDYLDTVRAAFGLGAEAASRAAGGRARGEDDPYEVLGVPPDADAVTIRGAWKRLMREHHPDSLASRGVPQEFIDSASGKVARINAAWDRIKRERGL